MARYTPQIHATWDNRQADNQTLVVEMEGMITNHLISFIIEPDSNLSYVSPQIVEKSKLYQVKHAKPCLV